MPTIRIAQSITHYLAGTRAGILWVHETIVASLAIHSYMTLGSAPKSIPLFVKKYKCHTFSCILFTYKRQAYIHIYIYKLLLMKIIICVIERSLWCILFDNEFYRHGCVICLAWATCLSAPWWRRHQQGEEHYQRSISYSRNRFHYDWLPCDRGYRIYFLYHMVHDAIKLYWKTKI